MARGDAGEMRSLLRQRLGDALAPAGWLPATPAPEATLVLAELVRPLHDDIAATASINRASSIPDRLPVRITDVFVGVCYEPLRRLWPLLGDRYRLALRHDDVWPGDEPTPPQVSSTEEAERAVETLAGVILREAVPFAESYASVERLLAEFGHGEKHSRIEEEVVALLAAAGRFDEARTALARYKTETGARRRDRETLRFVHQVGRYIDSSGRSIVPRRAAPSRYETAPMPSVSDMWHESRSRHDAVRAVRALDPETDRAELRAALERELAARGLSESPRWLEQTLDHLHVSRLEQARSVAKGVGDAADLGVKAVRGLREHRAPPDLTPPAWLDPPDRAVYPVPNDSRARWTEVKLDEQAEPYLERAYAAIPRLFGSTAVATAWMSWEEGPHERLVVSLGDQRVGTVTSAAAAAYRLVMDRATERDELPYAPARLTPRSGNGTHLLEVQLPATASRGESDV